MINEYVVSYIARGNSELCPKNDTLSYTRVRELFLAIVTAVGIEREEFSLHRLRSGGASVSANARVNVKLFKSDGCWVISRMLGL